MKKLILAIGAALAAAVINCQAQSAIDGINTNLWTGILNLKPFTTNRTAQIQLGFGKNTTSKEWIEAVTLTVPLNQAPDQGFNAGLVGYRIGNEYALGAINISYSIKGNWPVLGEVWSQVGDGVARNYTRKEYANFAFGGFDKDWLLTSKGWLIFQQPHFGVGFVIANTSDRVGVDYIGGIHFQSRIGTK